MSTVIDNRVVEMRFDNRNFESNVSQSMSTLEKLKKSLRLEDSSKGFENISRAAKNCDMSGLSKGVEECRMKFSALQVIGITALTNITNQAVNASKRIASALTIDPVKTGLQEYETQINAVQTILSNTRAEGTNVEIVNKALDELNEYADLTIYNFTEMTRNIGTFTAAGVKLDTSVNAIKGIANLAAVSGSTSQQASTAMYQLSQALASGTVKLMDWNSVVNAGMGGKVFQDALIRTSELLKTGAKAAIEAEGSFRESLTKGWLTSEVLTETLNQFANTYSEAELIAQGYTESQAKEIKALGKDAENAATKVKTFTQLWDVMKEAAQSGWAQTWRLIIGDFEEAKALFTPLADFATTIIGKMSDARNALLESALGKGFASLSEKINAILEPAVKVSKTIKEVTGAFGDLDGAVSKVLSGDLGNGEERWRKLTEAGYVWQEVQNKVNESLGNSYRHAIDSAEANEKLAKSQGSAATETEKLTKEQKNQIIQLAKLSDEQLRSKGYTEEQIAVFRELRDTADKLGIPLDKFIDNLDEINGRWLLINSFKNIGQSIIKIFTQISRAWKDVFAAISPTQLFDAIGAFHKFTSGLIMNNETAADLRKTLRGLFSIVKIISDVVGGGLKIGLKFVSALLEGFDLNILQVTGSIGDMIYKFQKWLYEESLIAKAIDNIISKIPEVIQRFREWLGTFKEIPAVQKFVSAIEKVVSAIKQIFTLDPKSFSIKDFIPMIKENLISAFKALPEAMKEIGHNIVEGLQNGLFDGAKDLFSSIIEIGKSIIETICNVLGIHSPSTEGHNIGYNFILGIILGAKEGFYTLINFLKGVASSIVDTFKDFDFGSVSSILYDLSVLIPISSISKIFLLLSKMINMVKTAGSNAKKTVSNTTDAISTACSNCADKVSQYYDVVKEKVNTVFEFIKNIPWEKLFSAGVVVSILLLAKEIVGVTKSVSVGIEGMLSSVSGAFDNLGTMFTTIGNALGTGITKFFDGLDRIFKSVALEKRSKAVLRFAVALGILALSVIALAKVPWQDLLRATGIIALLSGVLIGLAFAIEKMSSTNLKFDKNGATFDGLKTGLMQIAASLLVLAGIAYVVGKMEPEQAEQGFKALGLLMISILAFMKTLMMVCKSANGVDIASVNKLGNLMIKLSLAMILMVGVIKLIDLLSPGEMLKGAVFAAGFAIFVRAIAKVTEGYVSKNISKLGSLILKLTIAMGLMVGVIKLINLLSPEEMLKGAAFAAGFIIFVKALTMVTKIGNESKTAKLSAMLLSIAFSMTIMVGVCKLIDLLSVEEMKKGALFALAFIIFIKALVSITTIGSDQKIGRVAGMITAISSAMIVMAAMCVILGFIDNNVLFKGLAAVSTLGLIITAMIWASRGAADAKNSIMAMSIAITMMAGCVIALSFIKPEKLVGPVAAMTLLMGMFALMAKSLSAFNKDSKMIAPLLLMTAVVGLMAGLVWALSYVPDPAKALESSKAIAILLTTLSASLVIVSKVNTFEINKIIKPLLAMSGAIVIIGGILGVLSYFNCEPGIESATAIGALLLALSASIVIVSKASYISTDDLKTLYIMSGVILIIGGILGILQHFDVKPCLETAASLSMLLLALSTSMLIIAGASAIMALAGPGMSAMLLCVAEMGILMAAIAALVTFLPGTEQFLEKALPVLNLIGKGIGTFIGGIIESISDAVLGILPKLGEALSGFMTGLQPFIDTASTVDESVIKGAGYLAGAILALTVSEFIAGIATLGGIGLVPLGVTLNLFALSIIPFVNTIRNIDQDAVESAKMVADMLMVLAAADLVNGIKSLFFGKTDFNDFGTQLTAFGKAIVSFSNTISSEGGINQEAVQAAASAGSIMAELQNKLYGTGGVVQWFLGEKNFEEFGKQLEAFGTSMVAFSNTVSAEGGINSEAVEAAASAGSIMAELQSKLVGTDGVIQWFCGEKNFETFGKQLEAFGTSIVAFSNTVSAEGAINKKAVQAAADAGEIMAKLQEKIEPIGGVVDFFVGRDDLGTFGESLSTFGSSLVAFSESVGGLDSNIATKAYDIGLMMSNLQKALPEDKWFDGRQNLSQFGQKIASFGTYMATYSNNIAGLDVERVETSVRAAKSLVSVTKQVRDLGDVDLSNFKVADIGDKMKSYTDKVKDIDPKKVSTSAAAATRLRNLISNLVGLDTSGISNFKVDEIGEAIKTYSDKVAGINTENIKSSVNAAREVLGFLRATSGINSSGADSFANAINSLAKANISGFVKAFTASTSKISSVGANLIESLIKGMKSRQGVLQASAISMISSMNTILAGRAVMFRVSGMALMNYLIIGITSQRARVTSAVTTAVSSASLAIRRKYSNFSSAGGYLAEGFANGIELKAHLAKRAAEAMAEAAAEAIDETLDIASPSKVTEKSGEWFGAGFINGIGRIIPKAATAASDLASMTYESLQEGLENGNKEILKKIEEFNSSVDEVAAEAARNIIADRGRNLAAEDEYWRKLMESRQNGEEAAEYAKKNAEQKAQAYLDFQKSVTDEATKIIDDYINQMNSKQDSIMNSTSLFSKVNEVEDPIGKDELIKNLEDQITELENFNTVVASLDARLSGTDLGTYIKSLNVDSLAELQALNSMTDGELSNYVSMYNEKFKLAGQAAVTQLTEYTAEAEGKLSELFGGTVVDIDAFMASFDGTMDTIKAYVANSTAIAELTEELRSKITSTLTAGILAGGYETGDASADMIKIISDAIKQEVQTNSPTKPVEEAFAATAEGAYDYGAYTAEGYAEGMNSKLDLVKSVSSKFSKAVLGIMGEELEVESPSKATFRLGAFTGEGFVLGLQSYSDKCRKTAEEVGESAKLGLSRAIEKVYSIADMDIRPVISPVLDMTAVEEGAAGIGSMFGNPVLALGDLSNIRAVKSLMSQRNQNGDAHDIVSAIDKLRGELGNVGGTTYRIDGITYDDGSNISEAVKSLVRAAKVERRV